MEVEVNYQLVQARLRFVLDSFTYRLWEDDLESILGSVWGLGASSTEHQGQMKVQFI